MKTIRTIIADDHTLVRAGIRSLLERIDGIQVIDEACDGEDLVRKVETQNPELVFTDLFMPKMNGVEALKIIADEYPNIYIIVLSVYADDEYIKECFKLGATGYLLKNSRLPELELAIQTVLDEKMYLTPNASRGLLDKYTEGHLPIKSCQELLTKRQIEILKLVAEGYKTREIAETLNLSEKTIEMHRTNIMKRLDIRDLANLVRYALREGLVHNS